VDDSEYYGWPQFRYGEDVMTLMNINLWSVLVAGIATMVVGFLWYSPMLFARPWMVAMGYDPEDKARMQEMQKSAGNSYAISFVASLVSAFILAKIIHLTTVNTALYGMKIGFAVWLGFVTTVQLTAKLFGNQSTNLYLINTGYQLVCYLAMGAILAAWPR
jgi:hypothetical protein